MGEGYNLSSLDSDLQFMPYISACNVACGGHAGDKTTMTGTVEQALKHGVEIGAHPSYPDKENFGRLPLAIKPKALSESIFTQISTLEEIAEKQHGKLSHIKAHGALYHATAFDESAARNLLFTLTEFQFKLPVYTLPDSLLEKLAPKYGTTTLAEGFADRNYNNDGSLVSRQLPNALINDPSQALEHVQRIWEDEEVLTITGDTIPLRVQTLCVHSDTPNALEIIKTIHAHLKPA